MYAWQIRSQILNLGQNISYIQIKTSGLKYDNKKDPSARPGRPRLTHLFCCQIRNRSLICMCKIFWPKFSICDLICHVYVLFEPVYNILHNKIQIWTFDSDNRIDLLWEFNDKSGRANFVATPTTSTYDYSAHRDFLASAVRAGNLLQKLSGFFFDKKHTKRMWFT